MKIPDYYEFGCPVKVESGHDVLEQIPELLLSLGSTRPVIITDKGVTSAGLIDIVQAVVKKGVEIVSVMDDVPPDSDVTIVNKLADVYRINCADSIIAVGGGSVMDSAKAVNILVSEKSDDLMEFAGSEKLKRKLKPLIAVPTTAGTGSEVTIVAVIADKERNRKMLFSSGFLQPDVAVIDSRMTLTLPPHITAQTAMDALSHAVEAYTCNSKNPISDAHASEAITLIRDNLLDVVRNPDKKEGRLALAKAATLAGIAFSNSMVGMVHMLGHSVGSVCHVAHGTCMAIFLPYGLEYNLHKIYEELADLLYLFEGDRIYTDTPGKQRAEKTIESIRKLNQELHIATDGRHFRYLKEITDHEGNQVVPEDKLEEIARIAMGDGTVFYSPEDLDYDDCLMVLKAAWGGDKLDLEKIRKG